MPITPRVRRIVIAALALLATPALAVDYWVKNGGDDGASGTSVAQAWATLPHAADRVGPGDTVHVLDGSYQVVIGAPLECASLLWNPPGGARPRCDGDASRLRCH